MDRHGMVLTLVISIVKKTTCSMRLLCSLSDKAH